MTANGDQGWGDAVAASASEVRRSSRELAGDVARVADEVARTSERLAELLHVRAIDQVDPERAGDLRRAVARAEKFAREERAAGRYWRSVRMQEN